jgi:hypothetical protein
VLATLKERGMRPIAGGLAVVVAVLAAVVALLWGYGKAAGGEWDYCLRGGCISGWYVVAVFALVAALTAWAGWRLLRREREPR